MRAIKEKQMGFLFQFQLFQFVFWCTPISPLIYIIYITNYILYIYIRKKNGKEVSMTLKFQLEQLELERFVLYRIE